MVRTLDSYTWRFLWGKALKAKNSARNISFTLLKKN